MVKFVHFVASAAILGGCIAQPVTQKKEPKGKYVWTNEVLYAKADNGELSENELDMIYIKDKNTCNIESLKIPVPAPSCTTIPAPDCSGQSGFGLGLCRSQTAYQKCDYSSVNAAKEAQDSIYGSCMAIAGWQRIWRSFEYR